ncbi:MAG: preprotein translocase subunit YajC [Planctomycetia bacterium]|nr:preprotein translocase subunit YajC [Planctomycetia bacterium]
MNFTTFLFAQASAPAEGATAPDPTTQIVQMIFWMAILFGFLWFIMIRPQQREQRRRQEMWDGIKIYDKVITNGGVHGVVTQITPEEGTLILRIDENANVKIKLEISCVALVETSANDGNKDKEKK